VIEPLRAHHLPGVTFMSAELIPHPNRGTVAWSGASMAFEVRLLGSVEALADGRSLSLGGSKQRSVVAMLALRANRTVSADDLIDGLWGDDPPPSAAKNVQLYVSRLRQALGANDSVARIVTHGRGYELQLPADAVDAARFERLVERAQRQAEQGIVNGAAQGALELWRGAPLADVASEPFAAPEIRRLEELRLSGSGRRWLSARRPLSPSPSPWTAERWRPRTETARSSSGTSPRSSRSDRRCRWRRSQTPG
jgi:DNA-binding winged helix-turn-helix (wHTH) protein